MRTDINTTTILRAATTMLDRESRFPKSTREERTRHFYMYVWTERQNCSFVSFFLIFPRSKKDQHSSRSGRRETKISGVNSRLCDPG